MSQALRKPCRLCGQHKPIKNSHIFPKFYWDWLKRTGGPYFRTPERPNQRMQDGYKRPLLCGECEGRFSILETATANQVFRPIVDNPAAEVHYDARFYGFLVSLLWRNLAIDIDDGDNVIDSEFYRVEEAWRLFLLGEKPLSTYDRIHVFITDIPSSGPPRCSVYLARDADFTVVMRESSPLGVYAKFAKFIIWAEVATGDPSQWVNTSIRDGQGVLRSADQSILDRHFGNFIADRAEMFNTKREESRAATSPAQREKILQWALDNADRVTDSQLMRAMLADSLDSGHSAPAATSATPKVGRNEQCPCGSGKKFKRCHGR